MASNRFVGWSVGAPPRITRRRRVDPRVCRGVPFHPDNFAARPNWPQAKAVQRSIVAFGRGVMAGRLSGSTRTPPRKEPSFSAG
jgi:hypothetical protein